MNIADYFKSKAVGFYLALGAAVLGLIGMITYAVNVGEYILAPVLVLSLVAIAALVVTAVYNKLFGTLPIIACAMFVCCALFVLASQLGNIAMIVTGVFLGSDIPATFYVSLPMFAVAAVLSGIAVFMKQTKTQKIN